MANSPLLIADAQPSECEEANRKRRNRRCDSDAKSDSEVAMRLSIHHANDTRLWFPETINPMSGTRAQLENS